MTMGVDGNVVADGCVNSEVRVDVVGVFVAPDDKPIPIVVEDGLSSSEVEG